MPLFNQYRPLEDTTKKLRVRVVVGLGNGQYKRWLGDRPLHAEVRQIGEQYMREA